MSVSLKFKKNFVSVTLPADDENEYKATMKYEATMKTGR